MGDIELVRGWVVGCIVSNLHVRLVSHILYIAVVYHSQDIFTSQEVAVKLEPCNNNTRLYLEHEYRILNKLRADIMPGLLQSIWLGREGAYCAMVLESLGPSLFSLSQVVKIRFQLVSF